MDIYLHNTYSGKKEHFDPIQKDVVSMYNCGPTVYNYAHIGNMRSFIFADTLRKMFEWNGYTVRQVINITDVGHLTSDADSGEDKVEKKARSEGKTAHDITSFYTDAFMKDLTLLGINPEHIIFPKATDHIKEQIEMIEVLEQKGFTYKTSDGIYFDTSKFPEYGTLGNINLEGLKEGARIGEHTEKKNPTDFALWKFSPENEKREQEWESPWGTGFPGWHIECSAMSIKYLGSEFDIHTGGIDHIPVHHNNEIAQSVCSGHPFAHYWMHNAFLNTTGEKMTKSGDNFIKVETLLEKGYDPLAYRYLLLTSRYSSPMEFSFEALEASGTALKRLKKFLQGTEDGGESDPARIEYYKNTFTGYINDDLDLPKALALVWEIIKDEHVSFSDKKSLILDFDRVFGLELHKTEKKVEISEDVQKLIDERDTARKNKDFARSDELRREIESHGFIVLDTPEGTKVEQR